MTDGGTIMIRAMTAAVTVMAVLGVGSTAEAAANGPVASPKPKIDLVLSYMADAGYAAAVVLTCNPVGGVHPKAAKACAVLKKVGGKPHKLKPAPTLCTLEYAPITARIEGVWKGRTLNWSKTFSNTCDLTRTTGVLFAF